MQSGWFVGIGVALALSALWWFAWSPVLRWLRVLWVCRIPALSAGLGIALFSLAEPARDLFMESQSYTAYWTALFGLALLWAVIVHFAARKVLEQQAWGGRGAELPLSAVRLAELRHRYVLPATWIPRLLGLLCLAALGIGIWGAHRDIQPIRDAFALRDPIVLLWPTAACGALYLGYVILRRRFLGGAAAAEPLGTFLRDALTGRSTTLLTEAGAFWFADLATARGRAARDASRRGRVRWDGVALALLVAQALAWIAALSAPLTLAEWVSRAPFVVLMLALPVSILSFLSALSHQWRVPVVALLLAGLIGATGLTQHFHDLRSVAEATNLRQAALPEAVGAWTKANCPAGPVAACGAHPVIVASAGGASRAAFFTGTVVGELLDTAPAAFRQRLFAVSGVSGGAVGAAMLRSLLADHPAADAPPCARLDNRWFGPAEDYGSGPGKRALTWKTCLQTLAAGDFLSPAFIGLAFRDLFGFLIAQDRAVLLEQALERRYALIARDEAVREGSGLTRFVGQDAPAPGSAVVPRLLLNTTSVREGRRSIITDLQPFHCRDGTTSRLSPVAFDLFETVAGRNGTCETGPVAITGGVRLSTAATASARFPVISPQAGIRDAGGSALRDLLVDGGYFENDGLTTARELAQALQAFGLDPVILHITNNPEEAVRGDAPNAALPAPPRSSWHEGLTAPVAALASTRDGHAAEAAYRASHAFLTLTFKVYDRVPLLGPHEPCSLRGPAGTVSPSAAPMKDLSMSWWLSGAVQGYLDRQLCHPENIARFEALTGVLDAGGR
ncbi:hypothetical protein [Methylobacterium planeticum]|uniref:PNPLA domain-containing protein n=1 Tax=Methylobacterium planeticum TaxID=2615211 RepID=A0A6N6MV20_9HYPH|nr:hypothetical protein [Methylobacterium planeticum]KAB1074446.1 hypothetical protein F6X51_08790 [Methylobacterium planeticum]